MQHKNNDVTNTLYLLIIIYIVQKIIKILLGRYELD